jgi:radical SAM superfamily enzyme YgiQ (UPF0313 family)
MLKHLDTTKPFVIDELTDFWAPSLYPPLGLLYIGAALEYNGHSVKIIDLGLEGKPIKQLKNSLNSSDAVGISVYYNDYNSVAYIAKMIKNFDSNIPIIIGGPHCTFIKEHSLYDIPKADICIVGEGENVIVDVARFLQGKKNISEISGIYYREKNQIKKGKPLEIINNLDSLHFPARHLVEKYDYGKVNNSYQFKPKITSMITSRGCPFKCRFCARHNNIIKGWNFRQRSVDNIVKEMLEINDKYGSVLIVDDNFLVDKKKAHILLDKLIQYRTNLNLLVLGARVDSADQEIYKKMKKANVKFIAYGLESGNQDVLDFYNKGFKLDQARKAINLGKKMGFITQGTFIMGAPIETVEHLNNTIKFACSIPIDIAFFVPLYYQMGSQLWVEAVKNKKISKNEYNLSADSRRGLGNFTPEELIEYTRKASKLFYSRPNYIFGQVYRAFLRRNFRLLKSGLDVFTNNKKLLLENNEEPSAG